jgi:hypothetical protein
MRYRLKWLLILAFALAQLGMASGAFAFAAPVAKMGNCNDAAAHCCDFGCTEHCAACVACVGFVVPIACSALVKFQQVHVQATATILSSPVLTVDPPPPRA